ncbi:hypothetical protein LCGC14_0527540 [marine sediment metagenome]|uniref:Uncharacterized protein n=1 Tax=marine sediment metagenome TaxID=412755 RepID=A0A0F9V4U7_9ZZZZ
MDDVLEVLRLAFDIPSGKPCYPIHPLMWDSFIQMGWTEEKLDTWGFIKTEYIQ